MFEKLMYILKNIPNPTHEEYLARLEDYKKIIDNTPNKFLRFHLDNSITDEHYEMSQYIKDMAIKRGFDL